MSITPPESYLYGTVVFRALKQVVDSGDAGREPDVVPATGTVTFTPNASYYKNLTMPATFIPDGTVGTLDASGYMVDAMGNPGVYLMDLSSPGVSPSGMTYKVSMTISGRTFPSFDINVVGGETIDLTTVMPAATSAGAITIVSEASRIAAETARDEVVAIRDDLIANPPGGGGGVPDGGTTNQTLRKNSNTNGDVSWVTLVKADVGLANVDNTSDANKPVSTAQAAAIALKANVNSPTFTGTPVVPGYAPLASPAFTGTPTGITKTHVGLANVDNTADTAKPVSTAQATAIALKANINSPTFTGTPVVPGYAPLASPAFTGTPTGITKTHVGLGNVDNTADTAKPVSTAQQTALDAKAPKTQTMGVRVKSGVTDVGAGPGWPVRPTGYPIVTSVGADPSPTDQLGGDLRSIPVT